jgi:hypothetical protein
MAASLTAWVGVCWVHPAAAVPCLQAADGGERALCTLQGPADARQAGDQQPAAATASSPARGAAAASPGGGAAAAAEANARIERLTAQLAEAELRLEQVRPPGGMMAGGWGGSPTRGCLRELAAVVAAAG